MIDWLIAFSVRQRALVIVLTAVFILLGIVAGTRVPIDAVPDVTNVQVQVLTRAQALGPQDVESYVTFPIERTMAGLPHLEQVRSISRSGISAVTLVFDEDTDFYMARELVAQRLADAKNAVNPIYGQPELGPPSSGLSEVLHFEVKGSASLMDRRATLDWVIAPRLKLVPGVVEVNTYGGEAKSLEIALDPDRMTSTRLGVADVVAAIERNHLAVGGAYIVDGREHVTVRGEGRIHDPSSLGAVVVDFREGKTPIYLRDLGTARTAPLVRYGAVTRDAREAETVVGLVMMLRGASSRDVVPKVKAEIEDIQKTLPEGMSIDVYYDRTELVRKTIRTVGTNLVEASILVVLVLVVMLMNLRASLVVAASIPLALCGVFLGMWIGGISGNLVSLGAIDFGLVVDGAIIIVENSIRRLAEQRSILGRPLDDEERKQTVIESAREVRSATAFGEAIIALVYVPILALQSVEGRMFRPMAMTVLFALGSAFVLSITLVPALASLFLQKNAIDKESFLVRWAHQVYKPLLERVMAWPKLVVAVAIALFAGSIVLGGSMGREFLPKLDEGTMVIAMVRLPSVSIEQSLETTRLVEKTLMGFPEVTSVVCRTGRGEIAVDAMGINMTDVYVMLRPKSEWRTADTREGFVEAVDRALQDAVPGSGFAFTQPIEMNTNDLLAGISSDLAIHLYGHDLALLKHTTDHMVRVLRTVPGARDVRAEQIAGMNVLTVDLDRPAIARYGLDGKTVLDTIAALGGVQVGEVVDGAQRYPIQVRWSEGARTSADTIAALPVRTPGGVLVPIGQLAKVEIAPGPSQIARERIQRRATIQLNVRGRDIASFVDEARGKLDREVKLPTGYFTEWAGEYERLQSATRQLAIVIPIALALILVLLVATFGRFRPALLIFTNVPMSISGGVAALAVRGLPLSISAGVGFIALFGVAVLNGLVLITRVEKLVSSGKSRHDAVIEGAESRLRPVLTTALVASLGFLPMAIATGAGAEVQRPLATVVIGGLLSSTLLTLFVLPTAYAGLSRKTKAG
jgi:cobalt-zinc-cadmium resistance protein CzcA